MALRYDAGKLGKAERTPQGGVRLDAALTRVGVFEYRREDGSVQRELRHPDEVFKADSLATLQDAVLTKLHPGKVTPKDYKKHSIGHVRDPRKDGETHVAGTTIVQDADAVEGINNGYLKELSCGYACDVVMTPGEYNGEKFDAIQTNIRYNHVALGPENWGRAGKSVALRLDSSGDMVLLDKDDSRMETEKIDGIDYKVGSPEHLQALRKVRDQAQARADSEKARADSAETTLAAEKARADKAEGERDNLKKVHQDSNSREAIDAAVKARIALETRAAHVLGTSFKCDGLSDRDLMVAAIQKTDKDFTGLKEDGKTLWSDDYVVGRFQSCAVRKDSRAGVVEDIMRAKTPTAPVQGKAAQARADARKANAEAWKQPLTVSKK